MDEAIKILFSSRTLQLQTFDQNSCGRLPQRCLNALTQLYGRPLVAHVWHPHRVEKNVINFDLIRSASARALSKSRESLYLRVDCGPRFLLWHLYPQFQHFRCIQPSVPFA